MKRYIRQVSTDSDFIVSTNIATKLKILNADFLEWYAENPNNADSYAEYSMNENSSTREYTPGLTSDALLAQWKTGRRTHGGFRDDIKAKYNDMPGASITFSDNKTDDCAGLLERYDSHLYSKQLHKKQFCDPELFGERELVIGEANVKNGVHRMERRKHNRYVEKDVSETMGVEFVSRGMGKTLPGY